MVTVLESLLDGIVMLEVVAMSVAKSANTGPLINAKTNTSKGRTLLFNFLITVSAMNIF
jgi:hypothetical protein